MNLYAYVGNDPLNATDPSGKCPWCVVGAIISVAAEVAVMTVVEGQSLRDVVSSGENLQRLGTSAVLGAATGGVGGLAAKGAQIAGRVAMRTAGRSAASGTGRTLASRTVQGAASGGVAGGVSGSTFSAADQLTGGNMFDGELHNVNGGQVARDGALGALAGAAGGAVSGAVAEDIATVRFGDPQGRPMFSRSPQANPDGSLAGAAAGTGTDGAIQLNNSIQQERCAELDLC
jgi:hypothetical protein